MKNNRFSAIRRWSILILVFLLTNCSKDNNDGPGDKKNFIDAYGGSPFHGNAKGTLVRNDHSTHTWNGKGTVVVTEEKADSASMIFRADFGKDGSVNFKLRGKQQGMNYLSGDPKSSHFRITDNIIGGKITNSSQDFTFNGNSSADKVLMTMEVTFKEDMDNFPKGSVLTVSFDTSREAPDGDNGEGCQMRMVPIWGPHGMTMGMVPDCD